MGPTQGVIPEEGGCPQGLVALVPPQAHLRRAHPPVRGSRGEDGVILTLILTLTLTLTLILALTLALRRAHPHVRV